ncbi:hypothetical protein EV284_3429 [Streptomyces sp. BK022]|uniref:hypothetical protein n=1 Tax=Streptomyces sp. BK022 TaxID=2512123 RepID=UPI001028F8B0|nr:hypothetical protein [Streptomyces sp. BK022]RZU35946.1 hypothetical protein EV284_3429 [Streptomyces sp. BK022]
MFTNYADAAALVVGLVLPAIVAVVTKPSTNSTVKGAAHAVLAVATGTAAVYKEHPSGFVWAPAVVAAFLAWLSGTAFYHSLLKKYAWFGALQNLFVAEAKIVLNTESHQVEQYFQVAQVAEQSEDEQGITNDFPLSTDVVSSGVQEVVEAAEKIPVVGTVVQSLEPVVVPAVVSVAQTAVDPAGTNNIPVVQPQTSGLGPRAI